MLQDVKSYLGRCFAIKDLGEAAYILGIKIYKDRSRRLIGLCQSAYIEKILKIFCMENSKRGSIPMQEKLKLSKSQGASTPAEVKRMQNIPYASAVGCIIYVFGLQCDIKRELRVSCYTDVGYLTEADDLKSQTGYVFVLSGGVVDWKSTKQSIFTTSSAEAEYIAAYDASKEAVWIRKFIYGLGIVPMIKEPIRMYCDNTGDIIIANESAITKGASHYRAKVHYLREVIELGDIKLEKVHTYDNLADPFTKALPLAKHSEHTQNIEMLLAMRVLLDVSIAGINRVCYSYSQVGAVGESESDTHVIRPEIREPIGGTHVKQQLRHSRGFVTVAVFRVFALTNALLNLCKPLKDLMERLHKGDGLGQQYDNSQIQVPRESTFTLEHVIRRVNIVASATSKTKKCNMPKSHMLYFILNKIVYASERATPTGTNGVAKTNICGRIPVAARPLAEGHIFRLSSLSLSKRSLQQQRMFILSSAKVMKRWRLSYARFHVAANRYNIKTEVCEDKINGQQHGATSKNEASNGGGKRCVVADF
ncbi:hypothetical protein Tco_0827598, partial [Tanacetum coccineum]